MVRPSTLLLVLGILGYGSSALAETCSCMWTDTQDTRAQLLFSVVQVSASPEHDDGATDTPADDRTQRGILWCMSSDDPRCMPVDGQGPDPIELYRSTSAAEESGDDARTWQPTPAAKPPIEVAGHARPGFQKRVDRPPCA